MFKKFHVLRLYLPIVVSFFAMQTAYGQWLSAVDRHDVDSKKFIGETRDFKEEEANGGPEAAMKWFYGQRAFGLGYIPKDALLNARHQTIAMRAKYGKGQSPQDANPPWTLVGPNNIGGRINSIAVHPTDPKIAYVGAANGGVWKTTDGGLSWTPLTDNTESLAMGSVAIDPQQPDVIYAGTGELPSTIDSYTGYGLFRSSDAGKTWLNVGPTNVAAYARVIVNPKHSNIIYAAAGRVGGGVLRSTDNGSSWQWLTDSLPNGQVTDIAVSMNGDAAVIYAACASTGGGIYRSDDGGDHWHHINPSGFVQMRRIQMDVDPTNWHNVVALSINSASTLEGLFSSTDGGQTWNDLTPNLAYSNGTDVFNLTGNAQGWYDVYIRVDPSNFSHMLVGGISIFETLDGGQTWSDVAQSYQGGIHPDQHEAAFAPSKPSLVYAGNDGGIFLSTDGGSTYSSQTAPIAITQFYGIGVDQSKDDLTYGGTQDNGSMSGPATTDWDALVGGDGSYMLVDANKPSRVYGANTQGYPFVVVNGQYGALGNITDSLAWLNPFAMDGPKNILYWGAQHLWYSTNQGAKWNKCSKVFGTPSGGSTISAIDAFGDGQTVLVGTASGSLSLTNNNGKTFKDISAGLPSRWITCVKFNPSVKSTFYATLSGFGAGHVFRTNDSGVHWTDISSTLPDVPVNSIVMDPTNASALYIGTDVGVFFSPNDGEIWMPYGEGLPNTAIAFMDVQKKNGVLRAGTHGRSIWQVPMVKDIAGIATPTQQSVWVMGDSASIVWHNFGETVSIQISFDGGTAWYPIASSVSGTSYRIDTVNFPASENTLIKVSDGTRTVISPLFQVIQKKAGGTATTIADLPFYLYDIAYDRDENVLWVDNYGPGNTKLYKLDPDKGTLLDSVDLGAGHDNMTGIKYDPNSKNLWLHQVTTLAGGTSWTSKIFEFTKTGSLVKSANSPAQYGTGIFVKGDTIFCADRQVNNIQRALLSDMDFTRFNVLDFSDTRNATLGPRCMAYDTKHNVMLLSYTDFQGTVAAATLNGSYVLYLDPETGQELKGLPITQGGAGLVNIRGMEYDPRGDGNSAWITILNTGTSATIVKITLTDGPIFTKNPLGVHGNSGIPDGYALGQNYPNPFSPMTTIPFTLPVSGDVEIRLLDNLGRIIYSDSRYESAGDHDRSLELSLLPAGNYVYELRVNGMRVDAKKMTLIK